ncbi:leucine-rich repeat-containing protein 74B-like isoform X2, partial [Argonauta hians]
HDDDHSLVSSESNIRSRQSVDNPLLSSSNTEHLPVITDETPSFLLTEIHDYEDTKEKEEEEEDVFSSEAEAVAVTSVVLVEADNIDENLLSLEVKPLDDSQNNFEQDYDIEEHWDIHTEEKLLPQDQTGKSRYLDLCQEMGIPPASSFICHMQQDHISLPHYGLGPHGVKPISMVLRNSLTLEKLDLTENLIDGEGTQFISKMLEDNDFITDLNLSNNKIGCVGVSHIANMLATNTGLRTLNLSGNQLEDSTLEELMKGLQKNKYLENINLSKNRLGEKAGTIFGPAIGSNEYLCHLDLSWNHIRLAGSISIARGLQDNIRLKRCDLSYNGFGVEGGLAIAEALVHNTTLQELNLCANRLTDVSIEMIAKSLLVNESLQILQLGKNPMSTKGAIALVSAINNNDNTELDSLDLTNISVEYEFLRIVFDIKQKRKFHATYGHILRSGNTMEDIGKKPIEVNSRNQYNQSLLILRQSVVVRDPTLMEILQKYDLDSNFTVSPDDFLAAVKECALEINTKELMQTLKGIANKGSGKIYFGDITMEGNM